MNISHIISILYKVNSTKDSKQRIALLNHVIHLIKIQILKEKSNGIK